MDYKEKYEQALERARIWRDKSGMPKDKQGILDDIFPELKESEDERIRKAISQCVEDMRGQFEKLYSVHHKDALAWIEKQGVYANFRNKIQIGDKVTRNEDGVLVNLSQLNRVAKKQGEQKPAEEYNITGIGSKNAQGKLGEMIKNLKPVNGVLEHDSAWSEKYIADVFEKVGLAKVVREQSNDSLTSALQDAMIELSKFLPQQHSVWSRKDNKIWEEISDMLWEGYRQSCSKFTWDDIRDWIKPKIEFFKYRVQPQPKQEWDEKDKHILNNIYDFVAENLLDKSRGVCADECLKWLKSLKPQKHWKPSDEQMNALSKAIAFVFDSNSDVKHSLESLFKELKKL